MIVLLALLLVGGVIANRKWPFTRAAVIQALQEQSGGNVQVQSFRQTYLPEPGCVAEGVTFRQGNTTGRPFLSIQKLTITTNYPGLLIHYISTVRAEGLHVTIETQPQSAQESGSSSFNVGTLSPDLRIGEIVADNAAVEFAANADRKQALIFRTPKLTLRDLAAGKPMAFQATVQIPEPPAEVDVAGNFGAWQSGHGGESILSGSYNLKSLDRHF